MNPLDEADQQTLGRTTEGNHHLAGGIQGIPNVLTEVFYNKTVNKYDKLHFKWLSKKRGYLGRQVKLTKNL